jgi:aspartyl-tRNA(Asn)/glutamyl-tRNA(Gln) amidotransferase subunit A
MALSWSLDKLGPLGLTADDCGIVLEAIAGSDSKDPTAIKEPYAYRSGQHRPPFRLGVIKDVTDGMDGDVCLNFESAVAALENIAAVEMIEIPDLPYEEITRTILFAEAYSAFEDFIENGGTAGLTAPEDRYLPYARAAIYAQDYIRALRLRGIMAKEIDRVMEPFDAIIGPSRHAPSTPIDENFRSAIGDSAKDIMGAIGNGAGLPSISVPAGFTDAGLPTGIQFMGRPLAENKIIEVANAYQSITDWHLQHPTVFK